MAVKFENGNYILRVDGMDDIILSDVDAYLLYNLIDEQYRKADIMQEIDYRSEDGEVAMEEFNKLPEEKRTELIDLIKCCYYDKQSNDDSWVYQVNSSIDEVFRDHGLNGLYKFDNCEGDV